MRVLCVSPRFAPVNAADSHRLRLLLPYLRQHGCEVEVLAVLPENVVGPKDAWLAQRLPQDIPVHHVAAWSISGWGLNGLAQRSFVPLYRKGCELLEGGKFDLVFFSTTEFLLHGLGFFWKSRFGVPFCMDYQDPWVNDYYMQNPGIVPPGGRIKFALMDRLHRFAERLVVQHCSGFLSVSEAYFPMLDCRYGDKVRLQPRLIAGFPGEPDEMEALRKEVPFEKIKNSIKTWRYIGRGGADMAFSAQAFFNAWKIAIDQGIFQPEKVVFEAIGTSYATAGAGKKTLEPLAVRANLVDQVKEIPDRLGYREMLSLLVRSDALIVFGSDDPAYTASKIYPYLLAGRPLLAIFHKQSSVVSLIDVTKGGVCVSFDETTSLEALTRNILEAWFCSDASSKKPSLDIDAFEPYSAKSQAHHVVAWWKEVIEWRK